MSVDTKSPAERFVDDVRQLATDATLNPFQPMLPELLRLLAVHDGNGHRLTERLLDIERGKLAELIKSRWKIENETKRSRTRVLQLESRLAGIPDSFKPKEKPWTSQQS